MNADKVVDALREMIAVMDGQLDPDVVDDLCPNARKTLAEHDAQPAQAAQPVNKPAAWMRQGVCYREWNGRRDGEKIITEDKVFPTDIPLYAITQPVGAPDGAKVIAQFVVERVSMGRGDERYIGTADGTRGVTVRYGDPGEVRNDLLWLIADALLAAAPQPPAQPSADAEDAARYRWLRKRDNAFLLAEDVIDEARAAEGGE